MIADSSGNIVEVIDYYPFGQQRFDQASTTFKSQRKFIGEYYDDASSLSYLNARYYSGQRGQFLSQDPVFWEVGNTPDGIVVLLQPQLQNSYSYSGNNPITNRDPEGRLIDTAADVAFIAYDLYRVGDAYINGKDITEQLGYLSLDIAGALTPVGTGFGVVARAANATEKAGAVSKGGKVIGPKVGEAGGSGAGKPFSKKIKDAAFEAANGKCVFCGISTQRNIPGPMQSNADHAIAKAQGGNNSIKNAQNTCRNCNLAKGKNNSVQYVQKQLIKILKSYIKKLEK